MPTQQQRLQQSTKSAAFRSGGKTPLSERRRRWIRLADAPSAEAPKPTLQRYEYGMWGEPTQTVGTLSADFGYAGYYFHAPSGLNLTTYRAYSPSLGRWINRDPIEESGGMNLYTYVGNLPIEAVDPTGLAGFGYIFGGEGAIGFGQGVGAQGSGGVGVFDGGIGGFGSGGGAGPGSPGASVTGAGGGFGQGAFVTNAKSVCDLKGPFRTRTLSFGLTPGLGAGPGVSISYSSSGGVTFLSGMIGGSIGTPSYTDYTTTTNTTPCCK